jgi:hypothetical protein
MVCNECAGVAQVLFQENVAGRLQLEARWWGGAREGLGSMCAWLQCCAEA